MRNKAPQSSKSKSPTKTGEDILPTNELQLTPSIPFPAWVWIKRLASWLSHHGVSLAALAISVMVWNLSVQQMDLQRAGLVLNSVPQIAIDVESGPSIGLKIIIKNQGLGPAIIKKAQARVALSNSGNLFRLTRNNELIAMGRQLGLSAIPTGVTYRSLGAILEPGESSELLFVPVELVNPLPDEVKSNLVVLFQSIRAEVHYEDIYGNGCLYTQPITDCPFVEKLQNVVTGGAE